MDDEWDIDSDAKDIADYLLKDMYELPLSAEEFNFALVGVSMILVRASEMVLENKRGKIH